MCDDYDNDLGRYNDDSVHNMYVDSMYTANTGETPYLSTPQAQNPAPNPSPAPVNQDSNYSTFGLICAIIFVIIVITVLVTAIC